MKKCILILDDDQEILSVCKIILEKYYRVETRTRCDNIIKDIGEVKPVMVLMDFWIPDMGGESAIKLMKKNRTTKHIPVILFSANSEIETIYKQANANGFLKKPFEIGALKKTVENNV